MIALRDAAFWTILVLGAVLVVGYVVTAIIAARKGTVAVSGDNSGGVLAFLNSLAEKAPMLAGGIFLLLIAAILAGGLSAEIIIPEPSPSST